LFLVSVSVSVWDPADTPAERNGPGSTGSPGAGLANHHGGGDDRVGLRRAHREYLEAGEVGLGRD
jgi:hypothetical protein